MMAKTLVEAYQQLPNRWDYISEDLFSKAIYHAWKALTIYISHNSDPLELSDAQYHAGACVELWVKAEIALMSPLLLFAESKKADGLNELEKLESQKGFPTKIPTSNASELVKLLFRNAGKNNNDNSDDAQKRRIADHLLSIRNAAAHTGTGTDDPYADGLWLAYWLRLMLKDTGIDADALFDNSRYMEFSSTWRSMYAEEQKTLIDKLIAAQKQAENMVRDKTKEQVSSIIRDRQEKAAILTCNEAKEWGIDAPQPEKCRCCQTSGCYVEFIDVDVNEDGPYLYVKKTHCTFCDLLLNYNELSFLSIIPDEIIRKHWKRPDLFQ